MDRWACVDIAVLRTESSSERDIGAAREEIKHALWKFSPRIEEADEPGVFWLDASGLNTLYPQLTRWADEVQQQLAGMALSARVVVGFSRFGSYAVARATQRNVVFETADAERAALQRVKLGCLGIEPDFLALLDKLGVRSVAEFLRLPAAGLLSRFGKTAYRLHRLAAGDLCVPFDPSAWVEPLLTRLHLDDAETDTTRLLFVLKRLLDTLLPKLVLRGEAVAALGFSCKLERLSTYPRSSHRLSVCPRSSHRLSAEGVLGPEEVRPAVPTLEGAVLMDLLRLRLETLSLEGGVTMVELEASGVQASAEQLRVFAEEPRRDLAAGARALARLRAELGDDAVVCAVLSPAHLPEASFVWQPVRELRVKSQVMGNLLGGNVMRFPASPHETSAAASCARRPLIRRLLAKPEPLHAAPRQVRDDGWLIRGPLYGAVAHQTGPFLVSGGWWVREVQREYRFVQTTRGDLLWVYYDRIRRRLCLHAEVQ